MKQDDLTKLKHIGVSRMKLLNDIIQTDCTTAVTTFPIHEKNTCTG